ncbi:MAG TPA: hypothetical protein VMZ28_22725 [Kofleriaceae bacterium]|nr:hypothetical protein [Kofleriaceae bacterium]
MTRTITITITISLTLTLTLTATTRADGYLGSSSFTAGAGIPAGEAPDATGGAELTGAGSFLGFGLYGSLEWRTGERLLDDGATQRRHGAGAGGGVRLSPLAFAFASASYDGPPPPVDLFGIAGGTFGWEFDAGGFYGGGVLGAGLDLRWPSERSAPMFGVRFQRGYGDRADHLLGDTVLIVAGVVEQERGGHLFPTHN